MIACPKCKHEELPGTLFCTECGARMTDAENVITQSVPAETIDEVSKAIQEKQAAAQPPPAEEYEISLYMIDNGDVLPMQGKDEFTLGRSVEGQPVLPDIDLTNFQAYEYGVSRLHASLTLSRYGALITDLGSANGTRLNGQKLLPHRPYPLKHGDIIVFGKLRTQLLVRK